MKTNQNTTESTTNLTPEELTLRLAAQEDFDKKMKIENAKIMVNNFDIFKEEIFNSLIK